LPRRAGQSPSRRSAHGHAELATGPPPADGDLAWHGRIRMMAGTCRVSYRSVALRHSGESGDPNATYLRPVRTYVGYHFGPGARDTRMDTDWSSSIYRDMRVLAIKVPSAQLFDLDSLLNGLALANFICRRPLCEQNHVSFFFCQGALSFAKS
jgi:hypothetical protein